MRPIADEIIVAVDSSVDPGRLGQYQAVADQVVRFEFASPIERCWPWLYGLCSGDWILYTDGSDVMSAAFVRRLPNLIRRDDVRQFWLLSRWLYPDTRHWLDQLPWNHFLSRLVRNEPARLQLPGLSHTMVSFAWPAEYLLDGLYRTRCLISPLDERRERVRYYADVPATHKREGSDRWVFPIYLPEEVPAASPVLVPVEDVEAIEAVVYAGSQELPTLEGSDIHLATREEIDRFWPARDLGPHAYRADVELLERDRVLLAGKRRRIHVNVTNLGDETWPGGSLDPRICVGSEWRRPARAAVGTIGPLAMLPGSIAPGARTVVPVDVVAPAESGRYTLTLALVHETRSFGSGAPIEFEIVAG